MRAEATHPDPTRELNELEHLRDSYRDAARLSERRYGTLLMAAAVALVLALDAPASPGRSMSLLGAQLEHWYAAELALLLYLALASRQSAAAVYAVLAVRTYTAKYALIHGVAADKTQIAYPSYSLGNMLAHAILRDRNWPRAAWLIRFEQIAQGIFLGLLPLAVLVLLGIRVSFAWHWFVTAALGLVLYTATVSRSLARRLADKPAEKRPEAPVVAAGG